MVTTHSLSFHGYLGTLFLGALNDNLFKLFLICLATNVMPASEQRLFVPLCGMCFVLPFLLFSSYSGILADKFSKRTVMIQTKVLEIAIMLAGAILFYFQCFYGLLTVLFLMGTQSTLFSPAKYGYISENMSPTDLSKANGLMQLATFVAIVAGGWLGGVLSNASSPEHTYVSWLCVAVAIAGLLTSLPIQSKPAMAPDLKFTLNPLRSYIGPFKQVIANKRLATCLFANSAFWFLGALFQLLITFIAKDMLHDNDALVGHLQAALAIGIGGGCALAGYLSKDKIEYRFIAPAGLVMAALLLIFGFVISGRISALLLTVLLGFAGGFFQLPASTAIQKLSPQNALGQFLALGNLIDSLAMCLSSAAMWLLMSVCKVPTAGVLAFCGLFIATASIWVYRSLKKLSNIN